MYCTVDEMVLAYEEYEIERTSHNDTDTITQPDRVVVEKLIKETSSFINTFLTKRYNIPLSPVPPVITHYTQLFTYRLLKMRKGNSLSKEVYDAYVKAVEHLKDVRDGKDELFLAKKKSRTLVMGNTDSKQIFTRDSLKDL